VKVRGLMFLVIHSDDDAKERRNDRHLKSVTAFSNTRGLTARFQRRRLMIPSAAVRCKPC
jgi:hypothetical protein